MKDTVTGFLANANLGSGLTQGQFYKRLSNGVAGGRLNGSLLSIENGRRHATLFRFPAESLSEL